MLAETSARELQRNLDEMLDKVQSSNDGMLISRAGKPVAALIDVRLFGRIFRMRERFDALGDRLAAAYANVAVEPGMAEIDELVRGQRQRSL